MRITTTYAAIPKSNRKFKGQFLIHRGAAAGVFTASHPLGGWTIEYNNPLTAIPVVDHSAAQIGVFIGTVVDSAQERVLEQSDVICWPGDARGSMSAIEDFIYLFAGTWIFVLVSGALTRVYLDPAGTLSLVFDPETQRAGSTTGLLLDEVDYQTRFQAQLHSHLEISSDGWFPAGLTAHQGVRRLLANHYLDLATFEEKRHWPIEGTFSHCSSTDAADRLLNRTCRTIRALAQAGRVILPLTGGQDSRLLLASSLVSGCQIDLMTVAFPRSARDVSLAKRLATISTQNTHSLLPARRMGPGQQESYAYNSSHCVGGANQQFDYPLDKRYRYFLNGCGGEVGRAFLWRKTDTASSAVSARSLVRRFGLRKHHLVATEIDRWLHSLPTLDVFSILDLAYLELRLSAWAYAQAYAYPGVGSVIHISPMVSREVFAAFLSMSPADRLARRFMVEAIQRSFPELMNIPINRYGDLRDCLAIINKAHRFRSKLRKIFP